MKPGDRLALARKQAGLSRAQVAERAGRSPSGIGALENGQNKILPDAAEVLAPIVRVTPEWLLYGRGDGVQEAAAEFEGTPTRPKTVPLVGRVGAGSEAHFYASSQMYDEVEACVDATNTTVAAEIRGDSLGPLFDSWLVYYDDVRRPVTPDLIGRLCVVGLPNGKVLVKKLKASRAPGLFHLLSNMEEPMLDQEVEWAAKVIDMKPRG